MAALPPFSPTIALLAVAAAWEQELTDALAPLDLTRRRYALLGHLRATPGISFSELARRSRITTPAAHAGVASLLEAGLAEDGTARAGAASSLRATSDGARLLEAAALAIAAVDERFASAHPGLTAALRDHVERSMSR